jgi:predicted SAM-dependent methyltransferase
MDFVKTFRPIAEFFVSHDPRRRFRVKRYLRTHETAKLQLGSGGNIMQDWLNTDKSVVGCLAGSVYMNVGKRFLLPDNSVDYIYTEHMIEHINYPQVKNMLSECYRVMKPNGVIRIATPDLKFLENLYQNPDKDNNKQYIAWAANKENLPLNPVYVVNHFHTSWEHKIIYDFDALAALLTESGFKNCCQCEMSKSNHEPLNNIEWHFNTMPYDLCCLETMIIEAKK